MMILKGIKQTASFVGRINTTLALGVDGHEMKAVPRLIRKYVIRLARLDYKESKFS